MKRDFLKQQIPGITDEQINTILNENGNDLSELRRTISTNEETIKALTTERDGYKDQVASRDKDIKALQEKAKGNDELTKQLGDLQTKYDTDTKELQKKLTDQQIDHAVQAMFADVPFVSTLAKKAAIADFKAKGYKFENGKFVGSDGYIEQLKKDDPAAFKPVEKPDEGGKPESKPPKFTSGMNQNAGGGQNNPFNFSFSRVRGGQNNN